MVMFLDEERVGRLFEEMVVLLEQGHELDRDTQSPGKLAQIRQMGGMRGLMSDPSGRIMPLPVRCSIIAWRTYFVTSRIDSTAFMMCSEPWAWPSRSRSSRCEPSRRLPR